MEGVGPNDAAGAHRSNHRLVDRPHCEVDDGAEVPKGQSRETNACDTDKPMVSRSQRENPI
eukprot:scaffold405081_cov37-Prasinocladus_malaysianus.AAC.1